MCTSNILSVNAHISPACYDCYYYTWHVHIVPPYKILCSFVCSFACIGVCSKCVYICVAPRSQPWVSFSGSGSTNFKVWSSKGQEFTDFVKLCRLFLSLTPICPGFIRQCHQLGHFSMCSEDPILLVCKKLLHHLRYPLILSCMFYLSKHEGSFISI